MTAHRLKRIKPSSGNKVTAQDRTDVPAEQRHPVFCLSQIDPNWCVSRCQKDDKAAFAETLRKLSRLSWAELAQTSRHGLGYEKLPQQQVRVRKPSNLSPDTRLVAFRFNGLKAMVGHREGATYHILGLDYNRKMYKHG